MVSFQHISYCIPLSTLVQNLPSHGYICKAEFSDKILPYLHHQEPMPSVRQHQS
uniref:Uncharacterized protein n=1 Tax=Arundo donax TaxID=35708 RepID=A0A0A9FEV5_ARUDO